MLSVSEIHVEGIPARLFFRSFVLEYLIKRLLSKMQASIISNNYLICLLSNVFMIEIVFVSFGSLKSYKSKIFLYKW